MNRYRRGSDTGLGLASVNSIAEKYGGLTDFSAEGTMFRASVFIPLPGGIQPLHTVAIS